MSAAVRVGIAVVEHAGRYLVGVRSEGQVLAGKAEFPGGKAEPGEEPRDTAVRECREETSLHVVPERLLQQLEFTYDHGTVELHFWLCTPEATTPWLCTPEATTPRLCQPEATPPIPTNLNGFQWLTPAEMQLLEWPAANRELVGRIASCTSIRQMR